jgi:hypothetical protein
MGVSLALAVLLCAGWALAASVRYEASHTTAKSPGAVWAVISAYAQTCDSGCKYKRPNLVVVKKIGYGASSSKYYTWSHVKHPLKDVKYFTEVKIDKKASGHFVSVNRQLDEGDEELVDKLEEKTGLPHAPGFDGGGTTTVTEAVGDKTKITQVVTVHAGGIAGLWEGRIRKNIQESVEATFANIER